MDLLRGEQADAAVPVLGVVPVEGSVRLPDEQRLLEAKERRVWTIHTGLLGESSIVALDMEGL